MARPQCRLHRLTTSAQYAPVFKQPTRSRDAFFTVLARMRQTPGPSRLGLAISKKCAPRAHDRNRLKRIARESFRASQDLGTMKDVVVLCSPAAVGAPNPVLFASLARHWRALAGQLDPAPPARPVNHPA